MGDAKLSPAEVAVLELCARVYPEGVRLSSKTRSDASRPLVYSVHSRTAKGLEGRGLVKTFVASRYGRNPTRHAFITKLGQKVLASQPSNVEPSPEET